MEIEIHFCGIDQIRPNDPTERTFPCLQVREPSNVRQGSVTIKTN